MVPSLPWSRLFTALPPGPDLAASVDRVCRDTATVIQDAIDDVYRARGGAAPGGLDEISALYGCLIDLYLAAGRWVIQVCFTIGNCEKFLKNSWSEMIG